MDGKIEALSGVTIEAHTIFSHYSSVPDPQVAERRQGSGSELRARGPFLASLAAS